MSSDQSLKRTKSVRFGSGKARIPEDVHNFLASFTAARGYQRIEDAVWYACRVAQRVLPNVEDETRKSADIR